MSVALKKLTWDDIRDLPETHERTELIDGEFVVTPIPSRQHQRICSKLGKLVERFVLERDLGEFYMHPIHVALSEHFQYEPDLCFIGKGRDDDPESPIFSGPPDLVIEVISESNRTHDTVVKYRDYERFGVREYWLVDPREQHIRVFALEGKEYVSLGVFGRGDMVVTRVLDGLTLDPAQVL